MAYTYRERRYYCGRYLEVDMFPVFPVARSRKKKKNPTTEVQAKLNEHNAEMKLIRLLNANFSENDYEIHLTYSDANLPSTEEQAQRDLQNYLRRVKRVRVKNEATELKYIAVTEGGDGTRYHFHITMNGGVDRDAIEKAWGYGYANSRRLQFNENGVEGLAFYITKQNRAKGKKRWSASKNLVTPEPHDRDGRFTQKRIKEFADSHNSLFTRIAFETLYPGYIFTGIKTLYNDINGGYYLCARLYIPPENQKFKKRRKE